MDSYPLGWRVAIAQLVGSLLLCLGVLGGPVDSLPRALVVGACAGCATSALAGFRFPGWPWFSGGLACCLAGLMRMHLDVQDWPLQMLWSVGALLAFVLVWPISQATLIHVFGVETQDYEDPFEGWEGADLPFLVRGSIVALLSCCASGLLLVGLGDSSPWFAAPAWLALSIWITHAYPGLRPEWQFGGSVCGIGLLALLQPTAIESLVRPVLSSQDSFWLLGQAVSSITLGYWFSLWHLSRLLQWSIDAPRRRT